MLIHLGKGNEEEEELKRCFCHVFWRQTSPLVVGLPGSSLEMEQRLLVQNYVAV